MNILLEFLGLSFLAVIAIAGYLSLRADLKTLNAGLQSLVKGQPCPRGLRFSTTGAELLWHRITGVLSVHRSKISQQPPLSDVLSVGREIVNNLHHAQSAAESTCEMLLRQTSPETAAAAVLLLNSAGRLQVIAARGVPPQRIEGALISHIECALDGNSSEGLVSGKDEHHIPQPRSALDLWAFGIGASYFAAIRDENQFVGCIWLGFRGPVGSLSKERTLFVHALAQHCAASFSVAKQVQDKFAEQDRERQWLIGLSHDLRAPGNSALYSLRDIISEEAGPLTAEQRIRLEIVADCLHQQIDIVSDILDLTKHRQGLLLPVSRAFRLDDMLSGILEAYELEAKNKSLQFICNPIPEVGCFADIRHLRRVFVNLLSNALKYTDRGRIEIAFSVSHENVLISVSDTGIGIPFEDRKKLFQEFSRLPNAERRQGVGLGLTIAKSLCELNGGSMSYAPNELGGSIFSFEILRTKEVRIDAGIGDRFFKHILLVEDDDATRRMHARYLRDLTHSVSAVATCKDAIAIVKSHQPDVIVSDLYLENETSEELLRFLEFGRSRRIVVLTTGSGNQAALELLKRQHQLLVLEKPIDRKALQETILYEAGHAPQFDEKPPAGAPSMR